MTRGKDVPTLAGSNLITRANRADVPEIRAVTLRAYEKWVPITPRKPRPMTADYEEAFATHRFDCIRIAGRIAALIETVVEGDELMIVNVAVDPTWQGNGLGVALMRHAEQLARNGGLRGTRLHTNKLMAENIALYESLGYTFEKETHHDLGTIAVHMIRPIGST